MCESCDEGQQEPSKGKARGRSKLWELRSHIHCSILGTCLSMAELHKLIRRSGVDMRGSFSDYELHATMVMQAEKRGPTARNMQKMLDRKYARWIKSFATCRCDSELEQQWQSALDSGEIAGPFWALMTHPDAGQQLVRRAYEDVHMLSHLQGASNRADLQQLTRLKGELKESHERMAKVQRQQQHQLARRDEIIRQQEQELLLAMVEESRSPVPAVSGELQEDLKRQNRQLITRVDRAEEQLARRDIEISGLQGELAAMKELLEEGRKEHSALEQSMSLMLAQADVVEGETKTPMDLQGQRILYVGGRSTLAPHLRSLVEAHNGQFEHHDGGVEDSRAGLKCTLSGADMVFCPIDCISHDACRRVKRHCQQQAKQFVPLRSSGLSAFAAGLQRLNQAS